MAFVIRRTDQGRGYVSKPGSEHSYTQELSQIQKYKTLKEAMVHLCDGNEVIEELTVNGIQKILVK